MRRIGSWREKAREKNNINTTQKIIFVLWKYKGWREAMAVDEVASTGASRDEWRFKEGEAKEKEATQVLI